MMRVIALLVVAVSTGWPPAIRQAEQSLFSPASRVVVGHGSGQALLVDVNRDGKMDIVTRRLQHRQVTVLLGDGSGSFASTPETVLAVKFEPGKMAAADINHDGLLDLAVTSRDDKQEVINVLLGKGTGGFTFGAGSPFATSAVMERYKPDLYVADIDGDARLDILTANGRRNTIEIMKGDGRGGFSRASVLQLEPDQDRYSFGIGDLDGDGHVDVATAASTESSKPGKLTLLRGDGKGGFAERLGPGITMPSDPYLASVADVNGDRRADLIVAHRDSSDISILVNQGHGQFATSRLAIDPGMAAFDVVIADVNRDGRLDVILAAVRRFTPPDDSGVWVFLAAVQGFLPAPGSPYPAGPGAYDLGVGDVNNDRKPDIVTSSFGGDALTVLLGR